MPNTTTKPKSAEDWREEWLLDKDAILLEYFKAIQQDSREAALREAEDTIENISHHGIGLLDSILFGDKQRAKILSLLTQSNKETK